MSARLKQYSSLEIIYSIQSVLGKKFLKGFFHSFEKNVKSIINEAKPTKNQFLLN